MLRVGIAQARPGMRLATPLFHPRRAGTVLLRAGVTLDERTVRRLEELKVREIWIKYPGTESLADYLSPTVARAQAEVSAKVGEALDAVASGTDARLEFIDYRGAITGLFEKLLYDPRAALFMQEMIDTERPALRHASTVCMLSLLMGLRLGSYLITERTRLSSAAARDVTNLGVGAMLHDAGMLGLDPAVLARWDATHDESDPAWRAHATAGFERIQGFVEPTAAAAVLHHHQKFDGTGFPAREFCLGSRGAPSGSDIHIFARIIACADLFDRLRYGPGVERSGARPAPVVRALRRLQEPPYSRWIDPMVYRALLAVVPAYAPGTVVRLSSGVAAVVTAWTPAHTCRPTVRTIGDAAADFGAPPPPNAREYVLAEEDDLEIVVAEEQDVSRDNFETGRWAAIDLHGPASGPPAEEPRKKAG